MVRTTGIVAYRGFKKDVGTNRKRIAGAPRSRGKKQAYAQTVTLTHLSLGVSLGSLSFQWGFDSF